MSSVLGTYMLVSLPFRPAANSVFPLTQGFEMAEAAGFAVIGIVTPDPPTAHWVKQSEIASNWTKQESI